jgi:hypothetical protein
MAYQVIKTKSFLKNVITINTYLENEWGQKTAFNFQLILDDLILLLSKRPKIGSISKKHISIRKILVTKHNKLYYKLNNNAITLLALFDTRKNPVYNRFE